MDGPYIAQGSGDGFHLPSGNSAAVSEVTVGPDGQVKIHYSGKVGYTPLKVSANPEAVDGSLVTFHAVLLGATTSPVLFASRLARAEGLRSGHERAYLPGFGWVDSVRVDLGKGGAGVVRINSAGVGVDKGIELLCLLQMMAPHGLSESGRALARNPAVNARLARVFQIIESRQP